jgi:hypothetical protein
MLSLLHEGARERYLADLAAATVEAPLVNGTDVEAIY